MSDFKRLGAMAIVALVVMRMAIGWQLFYEGLWKYDTVGTVNEWTAAGYLKNSRGPLRPVFRGQLNDPDDLDWLDYDKVTQRWDDWRERFVAHYDLSDEQQAKFDRLLSGDGKDIVGNRFFTEKPNPKTIRIGGSLQRNKIIRFQEYTETRKDGSQRKIWRLVVNHKLPLIPHERNALVKEANRARARELKAAKAAKDKDAKSYHNRQAALAGLFARAVRDVYQETADLSFKKQLTAMLKGDAERVTRIYDEEEGSVYHKRIGKMDDYIGRVKRYNERLEEATTDFQHEHLNQEGMRIAELHTEVVKPVQALELQLQQAARGLLTEEQKQAGDLPVMPPQTIDTINTFTMWSLMVLGLLLIVGFFSRTAALAGGLLVLSFYMAMPPWPGVPQPPSPEHALIVNKNLLEVLALFALAIIPTGKYFGIDCWFVRNRNREVEKESKSRSAAKQEKKSAPPEPASSKSNGSQPAKEEKKPEPVPVAADTKTGEMYSVQTKEQSS